MKTEEELLEYVRKYGKRYEPALRPLDLPLMDMHKCFDNSIAAALKSRGKYRYVEGFAFDPFKGRFIPHAWLTDGEHAFDVTWVAYMKGEEVVLPMEYIGIEMDMMKVAQFMRETTYQSVLINQWRAPKMAEKVLLNL